MKDEITLANVDETSVKTEKEIQTFAHAQNDMRTAYLHGYPGVVVSGVVWLISGLVALYASPKQAVWVLLIGGAFIHPISILLNKSLGARGAHASSNPLGKLGLQITLFMIMCMPLAYALSFQNAAWFFQAMLLIIGGRYLSFQTLYGIRLYWVLGLGLGTAAYLLFALNTSAHFSIFSGAAIEICFGLFMLVKVRSQAVAALIGKQG